VETISSVKGVVGIILFGSAARGEMDEYSDYDLLVVFRSKEEMWGGWEELFQKVGGLRLPAHVIPKSLDEYMYDTEPTFRREITENGLILYLKYPLQASSTPALKPAIIFAYSLSGLRQREKMRFIYQLYGRDGRQGVLEKAGGRRLAEGCVIVPRATAHLLRSLLVENRVAWQEMEVYIHGASEAQASDVG
jgi:predicted nucleotidyltransferase